MAFVRNLGFGVVVVVANLVYPQYADIVISVSNAPLTSSGAPWLRNADEVKWCTVIGLDDNMPEPSDALPTLWSLCGSRA